MTDWCYDIEIFPNFFSATFLSVKDPDDIRSFVISWDLGIDELLKLKTFLDLEVSLLIGYNNLSFDSPLLEYVYNYSGTKINKDLFIKSQNIISRERGEIFVSQKNYLWKQLDLMKLMAFDKLGVSLKQCAINLKWKKIQDLPLPYDHSVVESEIELILKYNINDVLITYELYKNLQEKIELREKLGSIYRVELTNASDSKIANVLLEKFYIEQSGLELKQIRNLRTKREFLWLKDCISPKIKFKTKKLNDLKNDIEQTLVVSENNFAYKKKLSFGGNEYEIGVGGLHTEDMPGRFISSEESIIRDCDVASFYPNIIINDNLIPEHLDNNFIDILKNITKERIDAKKNGDKVKADGLKITINSIFGKLGSETFWLEDAKTFLSVTVSGQLFLLMLIESLVLSNIEVISANTDGVVCRIPKNLEEKYLEICKWWEKQTGFELEYTDYALYVRSDVNNYITKKLDGKTKEKGRYVSEVDLKKGYKYPIVPKCLYEYFVNNCSVEYTLQSSLDILDFCISQKTGKEFVLEYRTEEEIKHLQKTNRFYVSNSGGDLVKVRQDTGSEIGLLVGNKCKILNDYDSNIPIEKYDLNYNFYAEEANKYIQEIESAPDRSYLQEEELYDFSTKEGIEKQEFDVTKIKMLQPKFGFSKSNYIFDKENMLVYRGLGSLKYLTVGMANDLYKASKIKHSSFVDLLIYIQKNCRVNSRQMDSLIRMNFFDCFGNNLKLLNIYKEFTEGKNKYSVKHKEETQIKRIAYLKEYETKIENKKLNILDQINFEIDLFGKIQTFFNVDKRYVFVNTLSEKYSPRLDVHCLATGKETTIKIQKAIYEQNPLLGNDILFCHSFEKKKAVKYIDGKFVEEDNSPQVWWLTKYDVLSTIQIEKLQKE